MSDNVADPLLALLLDSVLQTPTGAERSQPRPDLRADVLAATARVPQDGQGQAQGNHPFAGFRRRFARLFDLSEADSDRVLSRMSEPAQWEQLKTLRVHHFDPGPARGNAHAGLVRCSPGVPFPTHRHRGKETTLYLAGVARDEDSGELMLPGDLVERPEAELHRLTVLPPSECVFAVLLENDLPDFDVEVDES